MTAAVAQHTAPVKEPAGIRKRRRRATAGGAADDCFTCSKRNVKCDRRRPYCSQCLEIGNECSGYKTQLTWGVGVASRGKLRGLSLPIAQSPPVKKEPKKPTIRARSNTTNNVTAARSTPWSGDEHQQRSQRAPIDIPMVTQAASAPSSPYGYDYLGVSQPEHPTHMHHGSWSSLQFSPEMVHSPDAAPKFKPFCLPLVTENLPSSVESVGSDVDYLSPISYQSFQRDDLQFVPSPPILYDGYTTASTGTPHQASPVPSSPPTTLLIDPSRAPTSCPSLIYAPSEHSSSLTSHIDPFEAHLAQKMMRECDNLSVHEAGPFDASCNPGSSIWHSAAPKQEDNQTPLTDLAGSHWPSLSEPNISKNHVSQDLIAKMPFFMDYYKSTMCPSMVYIDGPNNPFRTHILNMASHSQSLQHAICALAACNLRMKRKLSLGQDRGELPEKFMANAGEAQLDDPALSEEYEHRNIAVQLLNEQLNDPNKSCNDSVLATILLLCHYRMAESGIARFHTQFAGVKKILAIRLQRFGPSSDSAWMESLFTYFDAISASINDREGQFAASADILPPGAENLVGCDRELFKIISRLGRLNMLSQHKPVQPMMTSPNPMGDSARSLSPLGSTPLGHSYKGSRSGLMEAQFDGNNFGAMLSDEELMGAAESPKTYDDLRTVFWREWREARMALQNWQFDAVSVAAFLPGSPQPSEVRELGSLSEAFRYAALLYLERLAAPHMPPSHSNLQNLVSQVVYYATSIESGSSAEKFLLWPLFVAGSECVSDLQQNIVRTKCRDIMTRSGYMNNLSALDVLENLWAGDLMKAEARSTVAEWRLAHGRRAPFNWNQCIGGPGVEVEWIMF